MTIVKWTVSPFDSPPARQEYSHETTNFYMHARGRGRDAKDSSWLRYFDTEQEALDFIRQRNENKAEQKRVDQIKRHAVELLEALEAVTSDLFYQVECKFGAEAASKRPEVVAARAAIARAKGVDV